MYKGTKLSEFEKGQITALKSVGKSQREISMVLGHIKTVICNYLKSSNKYGTRKPTGRPEILSPQFKRRICEVWKSQVDIPCSLKAFKQTKKLSIKKEFIV